MSAPDRAALAEQLRANRARLLADKTKTLRVPGWDSLIVRYRRLPWDKVQGLAGMGSGDSTADIGAAMDVLIAACEEFLFDDGQGDPEPLGVRYEQGLAQLIGDDEAVSPPEVVDSVFPDELALITHAGEYVAWAMRIEEEASERLGKTSGQTGE